MEINNSHKNTKNNFVLGCTNIQKSFGGLIALDNVSFSISKGIIVGVVGPNGAGKTTLFDVISGVTNLNSGKILFNDKDISNLSADKISCLGIQRTFQTPTAFNDLSVKENVTVGASFAGRSRILSSNKNMFDHVLEVIDLCQLKKYINLKAGVLAILQRKQLMIATALAGMPKLLMLDEPLSGLNKDARNQMLEFLFKLKNTGISLLIIEHVMSALLNFVDEIILLNYGKIIFTGSPKQAVNDEEVIRAPRRRGRGSILGSRNSEMSKFTRVGGSGIHVGFCSSML